MSDLELKQALNAYTQKGVDREGMLKEELMARLPVQTSRGKVIGRLAAVAAALLLVVSLVSFAPAGRAFAATVGERVMVLIEKIFPPKKIVVTPEGEPEAVTHKPHGDGPTLDQEETITPGYVIYIDEEIYTTEEVEGRMEIVPRNPPTAVRDNGEPVPACMLTVEHRTELPFADAEKALTDELSTRCADVELVEDGGQTEKGVIRLSARDGLTWDALCLEVRVVDDNQGGVYVLTAQYFMESTEGHGMRFSAMMDTFQLVK